MKADVFHAIADPRRRAILLLLANQNMTPNNLAANFECSRQAVSKHIRVLVDSQMLRQKKSGREIFYSLNRSKIDEIDKWLNRFKLSMEQRFDQLDKVLSKTKTSKR